MTKYWKKYLFWFAQEHVEFRIAEIESITKLFGITLRRLSEDPMKPFWIVELPNEESVHKIASRSISLRCILELWGYSNKSVSEMHQNVRSFIESDPETSKCFQPDTSFKITVETYNKHFSQKDKVKKIETFDYLPLAGQVDLKTPKVEWMYIEFYGLDPKIVPAEPYDSIFGKLISDGRRSLIKELSLKERKFIGNTSMDAQLSLLMANQAMVNRGDLVFDPFVGTGSLLVSAAKFGGYVMGADIDYMMVHAKSRPSRITQKVREDDESIRANLKQYNCDQYYLDILVSDFSNPLWRDSLQFDSIITDPPYGIRESTEKIETKVQSKPNSRKPDTPHYPSTSHYSLQHLYADLLIFSAKHLKMNGRLVCWLPFHRDDYSDDMVPSHPSLQLVSNSEQPLSGLTCRRLLTYEKVSEPTNEEDLSKLESIVDFREKYFAYGAESREERRVRRARLREMGRQEAIKRGKTVDENGKVVKNKIEK